MANYVRARAPRRLRQAAGRSYLLDCSRLTIGRGLNAADLEGPGPENQTGAGLLRLGDPRQLGAAQPAPRRAAIPAPARGTPPAGAGAVAITPSAGPAGTTFALGGAGFAPNAQLVIVIADAANRPVVRGQVRAGADGRFGTGYDSTGDPPGQYAVVVGYGDGTVLVTATYTVR